MSTAQNDRNLTIRHYRPSDRDDVARVCLQTGAAGADATGLYSDDLLVPDVAALPYLTYEPDLALVIDNGERVVGYVIGVADTARLVEWWKTSWAPGFASRHPRPDDPKVPDGGIPEAQLHALAMHPECMLLPEIDEYPAHLHIDLLPEAQGRGLGRQLVEGFLAQLKERGVSRLHLGVDTNNVGALAFYNRLGFHELPCTTSAFAVLGISTSN